MKDAIAAAFRWGAGFLNDKAGPSSTRLIMLTTALVPLTVWTALSIYHLRMESIPESVLVFIGMGLGLKGVDKALATRLSVAAVEKDKPEPAAPVPAVPPSSAVEVNVNPSGG